MDIPARAVEKEGPQHTMTLLLHHLHQTPIGGLRKGNGLFFNLFVCEGGLKEEKQLPGLDVVIGHVLQKIHQHVVDATITLEENGYRRRDGLRGEERVSQRNDGGDVKLVNVHGKNVCGELNIEIGSTDGTVENGPNNGVLPLRRDGEKRFGDLSHDTVWKDGKELLLADNDRIPREFDELVKGEIVYDVVVVVDHPFEQLDDQ